MHYLYILYSEKTDHYYSGQTKNVKKRFTKHNRGHSVSTKSGIPWRLEKVVEFETKTEAIKAEKLVEENEKQKSDRASYKRRD